MTRRLRGTLAAAGLSLGWLAAAAVAVPPVLDRVPDNAMIVVTAPSADAVQKNFQALVTAAELPIPAVPKIEDLLASGGITQGLDTTKSMAVVVFAPSPEQIAAKAKAKADAKAKPAKDAKEGEVDIAPDDDADADDKPSVVALVPVTNYADLMKNFEAGAGAEKGADGISKVGMPDGSDGFFKDVGEGYAAMSSDKDLLGKFQAKSGAAAIKGKLGKAGTALADSFDVIAIVNMDVVRPMWPMIKKELEKGVKEAAESLPMGEAPNPMDNPVFTWLSDMLVRDSKAVVGGLKTGNTGINMDLAVNFNDGTQMAKMFTGKANAGGLLAKLPSSPYLFAAAMDISSADIKSFMKELSEKGADMAKALGMESGPKRLQATDGMSVVVGVPVGGIFGGLLTSTVTYSATRDATGYVTAQKEDFAAMNGKKQEGFSLESTYKDAGSKVDGVDVDEYAVKFKVDPDSDAAAMAPQMINAIFGPSGGPAGYILKTEGGVYQTYGRNSQLLSAAMKADKGGAESLGGDKLMTQVAAGLPANRIGEAYIGTKGLLDLIVPAAAMFTGVQVPPDQIPDSLPPVGMSVSGVEGAAHLSMFLPAPVIKTAAKIGMAVQKQMDEGFGEGAEGGEADAPKGDKAGTGQPRF